jgi:hypothetical protein
MRMIDEQKHAKWQFSSFERFGSQRLLEPANSLYMATIEHRQVNRNLGSHTKVSIRERPMCAQPAQNRE